MRNAIGGFGLVWVAALGLLASGLVWAPEAEAGLAVSDPGLPPVTGEWVSDPDTQMLDYGGVVQGYDVHLFGFESIVRQDVGADEHITCNASLTAIVSSFPGEPMVLFQGPMEILVFGKAGQTVGTFPAEVLSLDAGAAGFPLVLLRESPTLSSMGEVTVTDLGGGTWTIDSFFDVFTDLSPDDGASWLPDATAHHLVLLPEPATLSLLAMGGLALAARRVRNGRRG
jgi:hypothetical protein